jgi:hypothetical protein
VVNFFNTSALRIHKVHQVLLLLSILFTALFEKYFYLAIIQMNNHYLNINFNQYRLAPVGLGIAAIVVIITVIVNNGG